MTVWAVVPVKPLRRGKSRLSTILDMESRIALNLCLLENTLETLSAVPEIEQVLVVSRDPQALAAARSHKARTIQETGTPNLNQALERATLFARRHAVHGMLIIPADLPLINSFDIQRMLSLAVTSSMVIIAPDRHRTGTNSLFVSPPGVITYCFGADSFQLHCQQALFAGAQLEIVNFPAFALDLDLPEDLELIRKQMEVLERDSLGPFQFLKEMEGFKPDLEVNDQNSQCLEKVRMLEFGDKNASKYR